MVTRSALRSVGTRTRRPRAHPDARLERIATTAPIPRDDDPRTVLGGAFELLAGLRRLGDARVSELQRASGLPRTTVHRLLAQLAELDAVERTDGRWRLGPTLAQLGAAVPAEPRLRALARRPLLALSNATGGVVGLNVEMAGRSVVLDVFAGAARFPQEPEPGSAFSLELTQYAFVRAHHGGRRDDHSPAIDAGGVHRRVSCVAVPVRLTPRDVASIWAMAPGGTGVPAPSVAATRQAAGLIAAALARPRLV